MSLILAGKSELAAFKLNPPCPVVELVMLPGNRVWICWKTALDNPVLMPIDNRASIMACCCHSRKYRGSLKGLYSERTRQDYEARCAVCGEINGERGKKPPCDKCGGNLCEACCDAAQRVSAP